MTDPRTTDSRTTPRRPAGALRGALTLALALFALAACDSGPGEPPPPPEPPETQMVTLTIQAMDAEADTLVTSATLTAGGETVGNGGEAELTREQGTELTVTAEAEGFEPLERALTFDKSRTVPLKLVALDEPPADVCEDPDALNTGDPLPCEYPDEPDLITITGEAFDAETDDLVENAQWLDARADTVLAQGGEVSFQWAAGVMLELRIEAEGYEPSLGTTTTSDTDVFLGISLEAVSSDTMVTGATISLNPDELSYVSSKAGHLEAYVMQNIIILPRNAPRPVGPITFSGERRLSADQEDEGFAYLFDCGPGRGTEAGGRIFTSPIIPDEPGKSGWVPFAVEVSAQLFRVDEECVMKFVHQRTITHGTPGNGGDDVVFSDPNDPDQPGYMLSRWPYISED